MDFSKQFWERAYKINAPGMIGICYRYVADREIAEDLVQDAFLTAIDKSATYTGAGSFEGWLRKIAVNTSLMYLRQKHNRKINEELIRSDYDSYGADESEPESENIRTVIEQAEFSNLELLETINSLPEHHRLVFNLYVIDNYTHVQIGEELKISTGTSKSHLARARKRVRQLLYEKAMEKNQAMKKNRRALFLLIFPAKSNYIDEIFRRKFQNYSLQPLKEPSFFADSDRWNQEIIYRAPWYSRLKKYWIAGPVSGFILLALLVYVKFGLTQADIPVDKSEIKESVVPVVKAGGPPPSEGNAKAIPDADSLQKVNKEKKTVVIYKTIIQHKPLIIRDTIKIKDTTSAK